MTIRRQYSLPNCTLVLDGLSDGSSTTGIADPRPVMSSLFNAECHFVGHEQPLFGGRDFLTSLVTTVSNYAQEFLSGIPHPLQPQSDAKLVSLVKGSRDNIHHLQATLDANSERAIAGSTTATEPIQVRSARSDRSISRRQTDVAGYHDSAPAHSQSYCRTDLHPRSASGLGSS
jgi:Domain of unknown function (DUF4335)